MAFEGFLTTPAMAGLLDQRAIIQAMMDYEAALARAQGRAGLIPAAAGGTIASLCRVELYDVAAISAQGARIGSLAQAVIDKLRETAALFDPAAACFVHWGGCAQDVTESALALQTRRSLGVIEDELLCLCGRLLEQVEADAARPMLVRAQQRPLTVGSANLQLARWVGPLLRSAQALRSQADAALTLQWGGRPGLPSGSDAPMAAVAAVMSAGLGLPLPPPGQASQRDRWVRLGTELGIVCGSLARLARDLALLSLPEVGELSLCESSVDATLRPGRTSVCTQALAAAQRAPQRVAALLAGMSQDQGLGHWQAEAAEWSSLLLSSHGAVHGLALAVADLRLLPARMLENIDLQRDLLFVDSLRMLLLPALGLSATEQLLAGLCARVRQGEGPLRRLTLAWYEQQGAQLLQGMSARQIESLFDAQWAAVQADGRAEALLTEARGQLSALLDRPHFGPSAVGAL